MTVPLSPGDAARIYEKSVETIYRLADYYGWRRINYKGRVYYDANEVDADLADFNRDPGAC